MAGNVAPTQLLWGSQQALIILELYSLCRFRLLFSFSVLLVCFVSFNRICRYGHLKGFDFPSRFRIPKSSINVLFKRSYMDFNVYEFWKKFYIWTVRSAYHSQKVHMWTARFAPATKSQDPIPNLYPIMVVNPKTQSTQP